MGKYGRLGKNTILVFIGNIGSKLIYLILLPFYTRHLSADEFGSTDLITVYATVLMGIVSCCIYDSVFIFPKDRSDFRKRKYFSSAAAFCAAVTALCALAAALINIAAQYGFAHGFFVDNVWAIMGMMTAMFVQQTVQQFTRAIDRIAVYSITGIVQTAAVALFAFLLIPDMGISGYVLSCMGGGFAAALFSFVCSGAWRYLRLRDIDHAALTEMLRYSVPLIPNSIMMFLLSMFNRPVLEYFTGLTAVGVFAVAYRIAGTANVVFMVFQQAWLISAMEESRKEGYERFYNQMLKMVVTVQIVYAVALTAAGRLIVELFTTPDYFEACIFIPMLTAGVVFGNIAGFVGTNFATTRKSKYYFYSTVWSGVASVLLNFVLIPLFGIWGACWSLLVSQAVNMVMRIVYSQRIVKINDLVFAVWSVILLAANIVTSFFVENLAFRCVLFASILLILGYMCRDSIIYIVNILKSRTRNEQKISH